MKTLLTILTIVFLSACTQQPTAIKTDCVQVENGLQCKVIK